MRGSKWFDERACTGGGVEWVSDRKFTTEGTEDTEAGARTRSRDSSGSLRPLWFNSGSHLLERNGMVEPQTHADEHRWRKGPLSPG